MKLTFGRKFVVWLVVTACLIGILVLFALKTTGVVNANVLVVYGILITTMGVMYVGGNVWNKWVKSRWFQSDMLDKDR